MAWPRVFRGVVVDQSLDAHTFQDAPRTREQELEITHAEKHALARRMVGIPVDVEHGDRDVGFVLASEVDKKGRLCASAVLRDPKWGKALERAIDTGILCGLSLCHLAETAEPKRLALCVNGARKGTGLFAPRNDASQDKSFAATRQRLKLPPLPVMASAAAAPAPAPPAEATEKPAASAPTPMESEAAPAALGPEEVLQRLLTDPRIDTRVRNGVSGMFDVADKAIAERDKQLQELKQQVEALQKKAAKAESSETQALRQFFDVLNALTLQSGAEIGAEDRSALEKAFQANDLAAVAVRASGGLVRASALLQNYARARPAEEEDLAVRAAAKSWRNIQQRGLAAATADAPAPPREVAASAAAAAAAPAPVEKSFGYYEVPQDHPVIQAMKRARTHQQQQQQ